MSDEIDVATLKKAHKEAQRRDQYARQAAKRHKALESIQRYKELYPELYAELEKTAKRDAAQELNEISSTAPIIVFTGELSITRTQASKQAEEAGLKVSGNVSKNTTYVVVGDNPGSKFHRATQLGTEILDEEQFNLLLQGKKTSRPKTAICRNCNHELSDQMSGFARISGGFTCPHCHTQTRL